MTRMVSIDADEWAGVLRRLRALETVTNLFAASVTSGRVRVGGTATLLVDSSGGVVVHGSIDGDGTFTWTGILNADGTITLTGPLTATGETNLNGPTTLNGDTTQQGPFHVKGATDITGDTALNGNMTVASGGGITIDSTNPLMLSPSGSHAIEWGLGAYLISNDAGVGIGAGGHNAAIQAEADGSAVLFYPNGQVAVWTSAVNGLSFYSPDGTKVMHLTNTGLVGP